MSLLFFSLFLPSLTTFLSIEYILISTIAHRLTEMPDQRSQYVQVVNWKEQVRKSKWSKYGRVGRASAQMLHWSYGMRSVVKMPTLGFPYTMLSLQFTMLESYF